MKRKFTFLIAAAFMLLTMMATTGTMWGQTRTEEVAYTLQPASGSNNSYAGNCDITINDIKWNLTGNSTMQPWRIGGKSLDGVDRSLYSKTAISDNITKIEVTHGAASGITINSWTVIVASDASFSTVVSTLTPTFAASTTTTINRPENKDWTGCYYKFVYNVTVSGSSNKFLEFSQAKFYKEVSGNTPYIDADDVEIAYNATSGSIEYSVENGEGNVTAEITTGGDWLTSLGTITATEVPFTCSTNEGAAERTATVTLSFDGAQDKVVTVTQAGNPNAVDNISDITATGTYTVKGTIVAKSTRGFIVGDGTGYVYYYNTNYDQNAYNIGDKVKLAGNVSVYGGVYQYTSSATITSVETSNYVTEDPTVLSGADMDARVASTTPPQLSNYIQYVGKLTVSGNYYNITDIEGATTAKGSISYPTSTDFASLDGKVVTVTGYYVGISSSTYYNTMIGSIEEVYTEIEAPTFSVAAGGYAETQTVAISCATDGAQIYYTTDGSEPTKGSFLYDEELDIEETTTIKAIAYVGENASTVSTAAYYILSNENTYTVAEALAFETYPQNNIFVEGIVSTAPTSLISGGMLTYYISADGTSNELHDNELQVYKGKNLDNAVFTAVDNIQVGDVVTIFGNVKVYNSQKEFDQGNYLVTWERLETVATPTFTPKEGGYTEAQSVTIACTTEDATIYYKTEENAEWAVYSEAIDVAETTTIWAYAAKEGMNNSAVATATYTINIPVSTPSITVDPATVEATAEGEDGTLTVTYENITISEASDFGIQFYDGEENELNDEPDWLVVIVEAAEPSGYEVSYSIEDNDGEARTAYFKVYAMDDNTELVYSNLVTVTQDAYVAPGQDVTDVLNLEFTGVSSTSYSDWSDKTGTSGAVYAGNSAGGNDAIQLRSKNSSGIVTTTSGGKVTKVEVTWNANTEEGRTLNIYGSDTAYESASDLYGDNAGTLIGTIVKGTSTELTVSDEYAYIGLRSANNAMYLDEIQITWSTGPAAPSIAVADATVEVPAEGEDNGVLALTYTNLTITDQGDFDIQYYDENGDELGKDDQPDWMEASIQAAAQEGYEVSFGVVENDGEARTAYFKVYAFDDNDEIVYSNLVTISQAAHVAPTATITVADGDANIDVDVNGVEDATLAIAYENLTITENTDFDIQYYDEDGNELGKDDEPIWMAASIQENSTQDGYEVSYDVFANDGAARTAYFKVFAMGSEDFVYSNLVTINQAAYVPPVVADNYELFNGDLEEGDYIIYYYNNDGYALKNEELNATGRLSYEVVTPENDVISTADATIVWHIAPSSEYWTIYSADADAYAASTGAKNKAQMLADGTDDKAMWTVSGDETYEFINKANSAANVNCNLRNNGTNGWACYATSTGGALSLYKKVDNTPSLSFNGSSANIGTYAVDEEIVWDNITITQHNLTENISLSAKKGTVNPASIVAGAEPTQVTWSYTPTAAGYTTDTITATSGTLQATLIIQFMAKTPHSIDTVAENGIIVVLGDKTTAIENENIDFTVTPNEGYVIDEITVMAGEAPVDFNDYETFYRFQMPDSDVTISATFTALPTYTVSFSVNGTVDSELTETVTTGSSIEDLPTESTLTPDGFTIYGWAEANSTEAVAEPYEPTGDVILYALLQLENAPATTENYVKVTEELTDWSGEYLIVYEDGNVAFNSAINPFDAVKNTVEVNITSSIIYSSTDMNNAAFTIASMTNGYSIQGTNGKYIGVASYNNGLTTNDNPVANTISIDELGNVSIVVATTGGDMTLKYNDANNQLRFRYYKSGQKDIQLYKKTSGAAIPTIINVEYVSGTTPMSTNIPESTCYVVEDGAVLTFTGTNEGTAANLVVQEGGQLIHAADVEATVQIGVSGYGSKSGDGWYLISSPVDDLPTSAVATGTYDLFAYDEATAMWWVDHAIPGQTAQHTFNTLTRGKGYLYANTADVNLNYAGTMKATNANITVNLSYACDDYPELKGYNLVGNPFSRNLTANDMKIGEDELGDDINVTLYYDFDATGTELEVKVTNDEPIKPGHGFFIQANENNPELVFNPSSTKDANEIGLISIEAGDESYIDKAYIQFGGGNTLRKMTFSGDKSQVYVINNREDFAAARFDDAKGSIPVHFKAAADGNYTINIEATNLDFEYFRLLDTFTGEEIDLLAESGYKFQASSEDPAERFILLFQIGNINGVDENDAASVVFVYQNGDELFFNGDGTLQVFDMMGRFVMSREIHGNDRISTSMFNTGVYVFRLVGETVMTQKIVVR